MIYVINILVLFIILRRLLWKPVLRFLNARAERVANEIKSAEQTVSEANSLIEEYTRDIQSAEEKGRKILLESGQKAEAEAGEIISAAKAEADRLIDEAREKIAKERAAAVAEAKREIADLAAGIAERILKREVTSDDSLAAAEEFFRDTR